MAEDEARLVTAHELSPIPYESALPKNYLISWWRGISLSIGLALGGTLVLVTGIALWSVRPKCPYFTSKPVEIVKKGEEYRYEIKACKANLGDRLEIKALQKHPWLEFQDNQDGIAILRGTNKGLNYIIVSSWDLQSNQQKTNIFGNFGNIEDISFSPDGQLLATVNTSNEIKLQVTDKATGKSDTQTFNLISYKDVSAFQERLIGWLKDFGFIYGLLVALMPGGYLIARWIAERNAKPPDFPPFPEPKEKTPTAISALNQGLEDEVQVAQAVHQGTLRDTNLPLTAFTETSKDFPVTARQMKQSWRYLYQLIWEGTPIELDVEATVNQTSRELILLHPVLKPHQVNRNELLLLLDQGSSMAPFHFLSERFAKTAIHAGRLARAEIYYFHNCPSQYLYHDPYHQVAESISEVLSRFHSEYTGVLIFSDAGAAHGAFSQERLDLTAEFLDRLRRQKLRYIAWFNPMPRARWTGTAGEISKLVPMFELSHQGLNEAIDVLRGKPTHPG